MATGKITAIRGVVVDVDYDDLPRGYAHALLVAPEMPPAKGIRRAVGESLCSDARRVEL